MTTDDIQLHWDEDASESFLNYGNYFIPNREYQMKIMIDLLRGAPQPALVLELCCGEGLLAEQILDAFPNAHYYGLDGSPLMVERARQRLLRFGDLVRLALFELADRTWRRLDEPVQAVVSSLAIHHLNGEEKQQLFTDVYDMLDWGGALIIADMVEPVTLVGRSVAADAWDEVVRQRSTELDGNTNGLDFFLREHWNTYRYPDLDDIDQPSPLFDQLVWLEQAGYRNIEVHFVQAGHALFSGWKLADQN